ncbi:MAG TPA: carboxypeptidase regulatory-like domain-containing protein [Terriglobales bacterium]|nr:carboxypeptidase regulatory-like domain-containing protein [Terriglobales bacterium]
MSRPLDRVHNVARRLILLGSVLSLFCICALAQVTSGTMFGTVTDPSGAMLSNATVTVTNPATGLTRTMTTSEAGTFIVPNLLPGTYTISVEAPGFKKLEKTGVVLSAADRLNAGQLVLAVGTTTESVSVTADTGELQLQSNSGERSDLITGKQLNDVAMNGRNVLDYMKLIPGVISGFNGAVSGTGGIDAFNINGTRANQHEYTIDGASNVDTGNNGGTHVTFNPDAIQEVKVLTSNYQAEFGKAAGGQVAIVSKGGTNDWHGNARFFHRHESLNANEWFHKKNQLLETTPHNDPALYRYNDIGYQIGGPIRKNTLFVFWSQEFYRQLIPIGGTSTFYTPTQLERQGDFSQSIDGNGNPIVIAGPGITNNKIDPTQLSPAQQAIFTQVQNILNLYPLPNVSGFGVNGQNYNFSQALSGNAPRREDILRIDYQINDKNRLFGRWIHNAETDTSPFVPFPGPFGIFACSSSINFPGGCTQRHPGWNLSVNLVSTIRPTLLNEFSVGPSHTLSTADGTNGNISLAKNGISLPLLYPSQTIPDLYFNDLPNVNFGGGYFGGTPWHQANTTINVNDNLTWVRNSHTIKMGMFYQRNRKDQIAWGNINGQFNFGLGPTSGGTCPAGVSCTLGDPLASALLGEFQSFSQSTARPLGKFRYNQLEFYVQDTWKMTPRLTFDYGMRFAWIPPQYDAENQVALFDPSAYNPANAVTIDPSSGSIVPGSGDPLNGMRFAKNGQLPDGGWNSRGIMPEPRLGFAYDVFASHKTVLRGGAGMLHDRTQGNLIFNTVFNNPALVRTAQVAAGNIADLPSLQSSFGSGVLGGILGAERSGKVPTVYSFSLGVQHELARSTTLDVAYVGTLSRHLVTSRDINAIPYGTAFTRAAQDPANFGGTVPAVEPNLNPIYAAAGLNFSGAYAYGRPAYTNAPLVPFKGYDQISYLKFDGTSNYNSLQTSIQRRFSKGFTFGAVYTWSKALTTANTDQDTVNTFFPLLDYRAAGWDRTHVFAANYVYDLPNVTKHFGGPKWLSYITDNYQLSGVTQFMTGTPIDTSNYWSFESGALDGSNMWGAIPYFYALDQNKNPILPSVGLPIRGSRDILRTGGMQNWDMSLFKNIPLGREERYLQLRLEAFNVFNHPNFNDKNYSVNVDHFPFQWQPSDSLAISKPDNWGQWTDTYAGVGGPRVIQLAAKFYF